MPGYTVAAEGPATNGSGRARSGGEIPCVVRHLTEEEFKISVPVSRGGRRRTACCRLPACVGCLRVLAAAAVSVVVGSELPVVPTARHHGITRVYPLR